jgi:hypothetical protein
MLWARLQWALPVLAITIECENVKRAEGNDEMSISIRILVVSALLAANAIIYAAPARAASLDVATSAPGASHSAYWRGRHYVLRAPDELIRGVRGSLLGVPFFGFGWYPGPARYYGPRHSICCAADAAISVKY